MTSPWGDQNLWRCPPIVGGLFCESQWELGDLVGSLPRRRRNRGPDQTCEPERQHPGSRPRTRSPARQGGFLGGNHSARPCALENRQLLRSGLRRGEAARPVPGIKANASLSLAVARLLAAPFLPPPQTRGRRRAANCTRLTRPDGK